MKEIEYQNQKQGYLTKRWCYCDRVAVFFKCTDAVDKVGELLPWSGPRASTMKNEWKIDTYGDSEQLHGHKVTLCKVWTEQYTDVYSHDHRPSINQLEIRLRTDAGNVVERRLRDVCACAPPNKRKTARDMNDERQFTFQKTLEMAQGTNDYILVMFRISEELWPLIFQGSKVKGFDHKATSHTTRLSSL